MGFIGSLVGAGAKGAWRGRNVIGAGATAFAPLIGAGIGGLVGGIRSQSNDPNQILGDVVRGATVGAIGGIAVGMGLASAKGTAMMGQYAYRNPGKIASWAERKGNSLFDWGVRKGGNFLENTLPGKSEGWARGLFNFADQTLAPAVGNILASALKHPLGVAAAGAAVYGASQVAFPTYTAITSGNRGKPLSEYEDLLNKTDISKAQMRIQMSDELQGLSSMQQGMVAPTGSISSSRMALMGSTDGLVQGLHRGRH